MSVISKVYSGAALGFVLGDLEWKAGGESTYRIALVNNYTLASGFDQNNQVYWSDVQAYEIPSSGDYAAGGSSGAGALALSIISAAQLPGTRTIVCKAGNLQWNNAAIEATGAIVYQSTGAANTSRLVSFIDFGETKISVGGIFIMNWESTYGLFRLQAGA